MNYSLAVIHSQGVSKENKLLVKWFRIKSDVTAGLILFCCWQLYQHAICVCGGAAAEACLTGLQIVRCDVDLSQLTITQQQVEQEMMYNCVFNYLDQV